MRILFLAGRETEYARNQVMLGALRNSFDVDVIASAQRPRSLLLNSILLSARAAPILFRKKYDLVFVGFYGHVILKLIAPLVRCPLLFDAFISTYDTLCFDRRRYAPDSLAGRAAFALDRDATRQSHRVLLDTESHVDYFVRTFGVPRTRFCAVPVGCSDTIYRPAPLSAPGDTIKVLHYSSFLPLHGVDVVLKAAAKLHNEPISFRLIGRGPTLAEMKALAKELKLENVHFEQPVSQTGLAAAIAASDICLGGHFFAGDKAGRVIPGKVYQMLAVGRPVIVADAPGNRELFTDDLTAVLVPPSDPDALAAAIRSLAYDARSRSDLAGAGRALYQELCSEAVIARQIRTIVEELVDD
jgi:glycosyltransferase involved in cell wall biosynthesis